MSNNDKAAYEVQYKNGCLVAVELEKYLNQLAPDIVFWVKCERLDFAPSINISIVKAPEKIKFPAGYLIAFPKFRANEILERQSRDWDYRELSDNTRSVLAKLEERLLSNNHPYLVFSIAKLYPKSSYFDGWDYSHNDHFYSGSYDLYISNACDDTEFEVKGDLQYLDTWLRLSQDMLESA